jgi:hypothetical protein
LDLSYSASGAVSVGGAVAGGVIIAVSGRFDLAVRALCLSKLGIFNKEQSAAFGPRNLPEVSDAATVTAGASATWLDRRAADGDEGALAVFANTSSQLITGCAG